MLNVFYTVDTEVWPTAADWRGECLRSDLARDIHGQTEDGAFGIGYQMDVLAAHGLRGVFLVESLFANVVGLEPLRAIVEQVQARGHEVQLHLHPEWLEWMSPSLLPGRRGKNLKDFTLDEQTLLLRTGLDNLRDAGARDVSAFRAGNYGANFDTLRALDRLGIRFDTSHNSCYLDSDCGMQTGDLLVQPRRIEGVWEYPVSFFRDWPGHYRHAQIVACSAREMETALWKAWRKGWHTFVIVSHSFEMIKRTSPPRPDRIVIRRFERLCRFLAKHRDKFRTVGFNDVDPALMCSEVPAVPLRSGEHHTVWRVVEQLARRLL